MKKSEIEKKTEELILPILDEFKLELWDVEYVKEGGSFFLRAYIDKDGGITINDCVDVSRKLSDKLDEHDFIDDEYTLEVSSPGVERQLKKDIDFERSIGKDVYIKLYVHEDNQKEFIGTLKEFNKDSVTVSLHNTPEDVDNNTNTNADNTTIENVDNDKNNNNNNNNNTDNNATKNTNNTDKSKTFSRKDIALIRLYAEF